ncbi:molybdenum cofactor guanylyltransferase [Halosolutus amylolyticus]|uniref:Probable molybdenum cofactor guanylyltransferase n=1 Tax=Halosolutus amylolyticus TaxID=2932267 RepID=A0ABD5PNY2_9EURY|nr:molybdenum cofactor guanylyltransferase [Halosolutus amylolyticus]
MGSTSTGRGSLGGVVLAGGYSTRFGETDKAVADLAGEPMIRRVVDRLATVADDVVINCRDEQVDAIRDALSGCDTAIRYATDPVPDRGPLAGIRTGLDAVDREYAAVVACDMPFVDPDLLALLADRADGHDGAVVQLEDGWYQTTQAVYRASTVADACEAALDSEDTRILAALDHVDVVTVPEDDLDEIDPATFESIDTREALADAERQFEA